MKKYIVPIKWSYYGNLEVFVKDRKELDSKLSDALFRNTVERPIVLGYVEDSLEVSDWDAIEEADGEYDDEDYIPF
jgi:hypothetical protein